jgi:hypothetical protein
MGMGGTRMSCLMKGLVLDDGGMNMYMLMMKLASTTCLRERLVMEESGRAVGSTLGSAPPEDLGSLGLQPPK